MIEKLKSYKWLGFVLIVLMAFGFGCLVTDWRLSGEIERLKNQQLQIHVAGLQSSMNTAQAALDRIAAAAGRLQGVSSTLDTKFHDIAKEFKNAKPLPSDCRPDAFRMRRLTDAIDAANAAFPGQQPEKAVSDDNKAGRDGL